MNSNKALWPSKSNRTRIINGHGLGLEGDESEYLADIRLYEEDGSVQVWAEIRFRGEKGSVEALQYLTPQEAMAFALAFERCAIRALKKGAESANSEDMA